MLKRILLFLGILGATSTSIAQGNNASSATTVLFVGNSYTHYNNMPKTFQKIAESKGENVITEMDAKSNHSFSMHANRPELFDHIKERKWDYVVLQGFSRELSFAPSVIDTASAPYLEKILDSIYANNPCTKVLLYMTWGYKTGIEDREDADTYEKMSEAVRNGYKYIARKYGLSIVPVGAVYEELKKYDDGSLFHCLYQDDQQHPTIFGSYAIATTFYSAIFRTAPVDAYHKGLSKEDAFAIQKTAYEYVSSNIREFRLDDEYHNIDFSWTETGKLKVNLFSVYRQAEVLWDLGDGTVVSQPNFEHVYKELGTYIIRLVVKADCGEFKFVETIDLDKLPKPDNSNPSSPKIAKYIRKAKRRQRKVG